MKKEKKADMSISWIVIIILTILGFVVLLLLYLFFPWKETIDLETCHNSVLIKAITPNVPISGGKLVELPLRCKTEKICISTKTKGDCDEFYGKYTTKKVIKDPDKQQEKIKEILAEQLYNCWWMMGEGKVQVFTREASGTYYKDRCVLCARIAFSKELKEQGGKVKLFFNYLQNTKVPGAEYTYLDFLSKSIDATGRGRLISREGMYNIDPGESRDLPYSKQHVIIFREFDRTVLQKRLGAAAGGLLGLFISLKTGLTKAGFLVGVGIYAGSQFGDAIGGAYIGEEYISTWAIAPYEEDELRDFNCDSFENIP